MKYLYIKNIKTSVKEIEEGIYSNEEKPAFLNWKNIVKMPIVFKVIYRFGAIPIQTPMALVTEKIYPKFCIKSQETQIVKAILRKKSIAQGITLIDESIVIKIVLYGIKTDTYTSGTK